MNPHLEVKNVSFAYKTGPDVLRDVSFKVGRGEFVAITGPSGSGKSTLFYILGLLTSRFRGDVLLNGISYGNLDSDGAAFVRNFSIGFVFQQFYLLPRASVMDNILLPTFFPYDTSAPTEEDRKRAEFLTRQLGIGDLLGRHPQELSGGQQQRVAIARALLRDPDLILADEPTGNLDSASSTQVFQLLLDLNRQGKTVILITHSPELAGQCQRVIRFRDGKIEEDVKLREFEPPAADPSPGAQRPDSSRSRRKSRLERLLGNWTFTSYWRALYPAVQNIRRTKAKSFLTMLGVVLGIAAVLSTLSLGDFTKRRVLAGYESMGVNNLSLSGYPNWRRSTRDFAPAVFREFDAERDLMPLQKVFKEVVSLSPVLEIWSAKFSAEGQSLAEDVLLAGVSEEFFRINNQALASGRTLHWLDIENSHPVCAIGDGIRKKIFRNRPPLDKQITIATGGQESEFPCRVIGVYVPQPSQNVGIQPDDTVYIPYTYLKRSLTTSWERDIRNVRIKIASGVDPDTTGKQIEGYFKSRYGNSGVFSSNSNAKAVSEMRLFVNIFSSLLTAVALIALIVGGVGINNMMLVNLSERLKELGLRKALGATARQMRALLLTEAIVLCSLGGVLGLVLGFCSYHGLIFGATKLIPGLEFEWVVLWSAIVISAGAVVLTGILSGLTPALKAEQLEVIDALRQD